MNFSKKRPVKIVMLGAGGTGAHIAPHLYRLLYALERPVKFIICDGDKVEPKNLVRQNFTEADLGENKARVIAERYSDVFGLETSYIPRFIEDAGQLEELLIIMMVMSSLTLPFPLVYLYGSAGIDGFICAVFFLVAANRVNKHGLLFAWAGIYGLIQGVMGYMFLFPYFLAVGLIAELSMLGKDTYRNPLRTRIGWTINCVGNFVGCAVPLWWAWDSYTAMALESGFTSETLEMQMAMVTSPALMLLGAAITAVLTFLGTLFGQRLLRKHFQKAGIVG